MSAEPIKALNLKISDIQPNSEADAEQKITVPYLKQVSGYSPQNGASMTIRSAKSVHVGGRMETIIPDIAVYVSKEPFLIVESKPINRTIDISDANEAISNARLYELPKQFPFSLVSTGLNWEIYDTLSGLYIGDYQALPDIHRAKAILSKGVQPVPDAKAIEAQRIVESRRLIKDQQKLYAIFKECKTRIEAEGKHGHEALTEISKLILAKIYEEEFCVKEDRTYRFSLAFLAQQRQAYPQKNDEVILNEIFHEANLKYKGDRPQGIFPDNSQITLSYGTVRKIVELLEKPAFYGGGEDIKGAVYETFLKTLFRGNFGQYFTPREVVRFMVHLVDPKPDEKILDPASGSGGFMIQSFIEVRKKILGMKSAGYIDEDEVNNKKIPKLLNDDLWAVDVAETLVQFCKINLLIQGDGYQNICRGDALNKSNSPLKGMEGKFKIILTNPPFDLPSEHLENIVQDYELFTKYGFKGADVLYLERCYELLEPGGRMGMVVPHRFIDGKEFEKLRGWILEKMVPRAVVNLPVGIFKPFGGSNARTSILYLTKPKKGEKPILEGKSLMATIRYVGFETGIQEYKPKERNDLETISTSQEFLDLKAQ